MKTIDVPPKASEIIITVAEEPNIKKHRRVIKRKNINSDIEGANFSRTGT